MPAAIGALIITGLEAAGAGGVAGFSLGSTTIAGVGIASIVGTTTIIGASIGLQYAIRPGVPKPADGAQPIQQDIPPRIWGFGLNRLAGYYMLFESAAGAAYTVCAFHSGPISAIRGYYLHDDVVHVSTGLTGAYGTVIASFADGRYSGNRISIEARLGHDVQAPAQISFDPNMGATWNDAHVGNGIAWVAMVCNGVATPDLFTKVYPRGLPLLSVLADCLPVWDPQGSRPGPQRQLDLDGVLQPGPADHRLSLAGARARRPRARLCHRDRAFAQQTDGRGYAVRRAGGESRRQFRAPLSVQRLVPLRQQSGRRLQHPAVELRRLDVGRRRRRAGAVGRGLSRTDGHADRQPISCPASR
jgi:hypothetical protein